MAELQWDLTGQRYYETGIDRGVLYIPNNQGVYANGVAWNGLVSISESPSGAEASAQYADNIKYLNLISTEEFGATIEAFTYPDEFQQYDGLGVPSAGVTIGQQARRQFGLSYRTRIGNDLEGDSLGYKIHLIYGCQAAPSEKSYATVNDSPEAMTLSWEITTTPVDVPNYRPTATVTIDSTKHTAPKMKELTDIIWGIVGTAPRLPLPAEVIAIFDEGDPIVVTPAIPVYDNVEHEVAIPDTAGVEYRIAGIVQDPLAVIELVQGVPILVEARPKPGYVFPPSTDPLWRYEWPL